MEPTADLELDSILRVSKDNIVITDGQGRVLKASPNCKSIYGKDVSELIGKSVFDLEREQVFSPSVTTRVLKEKRDIQLMQKTPTGRTVMATGYPIFNQEREIIRVISFSHDLTELESIKEDYENLRARMKLYETEIEELRDKEIKIENFVIRSKPMIRVWKLVKNVAKSDATVVLLGESGVGKTMIAHFIHHESERRGGPLIEVNCGAIPESLFESEMFGYESGSFTGANKQGKPGLIELADQGTLFLDELGELPLSVQAKLLKVLQEKQVARIGGVRPRTINFRLVVSTNRDLEEMVKKGLFRKDLYYRLMVVPIAVPSLKERKEDILLLIQYFLKHYNEKYHKNICFDSMTVDELVEYDWPGNVRELENLVERLVITAENRCILPSQLPFDIQFRHLKDMKFDDEGWGIPGQTMKDQVGEVERKWLRQAAKNCKSTYEMAKYLGISQTSVVRKLKKWKIEL
ncbi:sigma-54 interaction domain-containing protein [Ferviditalea candida]|uniref:HTH-type transcriptional regulatory protein TyrR n=1 Tax=Ferviditalea candida TaxID=3108399 RepID=A0ABU5ZMI0_9BACL|nr:sigma 54-interacting transcriptional regulator [Paenibacillaceae bacterium T2]